MENDRIQLPREAERILDTLERTGFEAYVVGGCVRDALLGRTPEDWDITTSASPAQVKLLFPRTIDTGIAHGTVTVMLNHQGYEVTTYRIDGAYEDGRHPSSVTFSKSLTEDLKRRDFTINAMAYHPRKGLVDLFGGAADLKQRVIRCVGDPMERMKEDALRILRALRFSAQLDFTIEEDTARALRQLAKSLNRVSRERIQTELCKLLGSGHPERLFFAQELGVLPYILPSLSRRLQECEASGLLEKQLAQRLKRSVSDKRVRLALLFLDDSARMESEFFGELLESRQAAAAAERALRELKFDRDTIKTVGKLVCYAPSGCPLEQTPEQLSEEAPKQRAWKIRCLLNRMGAAQYELLEQLWEACGAGQLESWRQERETIQKRQECTTLRHLALSGRDLIDAGVQPGEQLGALLELLLGEVLREPERNTRSWLLDRLKQCIDYTESQK